MAQRSRKIVPLEPPKNVPAQPEMNWSTRNMNVALYTRLRLYADRHRLLVHNVFNKALEIGLSELEKEEC